MKLFRTVLASCLLIIGLVGIGIYQLLTPVISKNEGVTYYLRPGMSKKNLVTELSRLGIIHHSTLFSLLTYLFSHSQLKTGEYLFPYHSSLFSIWKQVTSGKGLVYHAFTIVPGWSFSQLQYELLKTQGLRHTIANLDEQAIMQRLGYPNMSAEGEFFPDTYYYTRGISDTVILKRAFRLMQNKLNKVWQNREEGLPYRTEYEALIAASLVEKEAYLDAERPIIAGVLMNRLKKDMLLQFDPTVIYGLGQRYDGKIHKENLFEDTAYNTYVHKGLPPTPIAMPSMMSIESVLHPKHHHYYYFVAKGDGSHQFSQNLLEHHVAVTTAKQPGWYFNQKLIQKYLEADLKHDAWQIDYSRRYRRCWQKHCTPFHSNLFNPPAYPYFVNP